MFVLWVLILILVMSLCDYFGNDSGHDFGNNSGNDFGKHIGNNIGDNVGE